MWKIKLDQRKEMRLYHEKDPSWVDSPSVVLIPYQIVDVPRMSSERLSSLLRPGSDIFYDNISDDMRRCPIGSNVDQLRAIVMLTDGVVQRA